MKKKSAILFVLLFAFTMAFSFGVSNANISPRPTPPPDPIDICCDIPATPACSASIGHLVYPLHQPAICVRDNTSSCDRPPMCY